MFNKKKKKKKKKIKLKKLKYLKKTYNEKPNILNSQEIEYYLTKNYKLYNVLEGRTYLHYHKILNFLS